MPVVDASVVVDWVAPSVDAANPAVALLARLAAEDAELLAPRLLLEEVSGALLSGVRRGRWSGAAADAAHRCSWSCPSGSWTSLETSNERRFETLVEVVDYEHDRRFALKVVSGALPVHGRWEFEELGPATTRVTFTAEGLPPRPLRLAEGLVARAVRSQMLAHHRRLKQVLERRAPSHPGRAPRPAL